MILLGLDPGFASFGYAILRTDPLEMVAMGVIRTKKSTDKKRVLAVEDNVARAREIHCGLAHLLNRPDLAAVCAESFSPPRSSSVASKVALAWGVLVSMLEHRGLPLLQTTPQRVKKAVCGVPTASKEDVEKAVRMAVPVPEELLAGIPGGLYEHVFDAAAVALACVESDMVRALRRSA